MSTRVEAMRAFVGGGSSIVEVMGTFVDDHTLGFVCRLGATQTEVAFPWCGPEVYAAFLYADESRRARERAEEFVSSLLADGDEEAEDQTDPVVLPDAPEGERTWLERCG